MTGTVQSEKRLRHAATCVIVALKITRNNIDIDVDFQISKFIE